MKLRLENETSYSSPDLRAILRAAGDALRIEGVRHVRVKYQLSARGEPRGCVSGRARYSTRRDWSDVLLRIPRPEARKENTLLEFLWLVEHELLHTVGVRHGAMTAQQRAVHGAAYAPRWARRDGADVFCLRVEEAPPGPTREERMASLVEAREERARESLAAHEAKLKREQRLVRKWREKVRYYNKSLEKRAALKGT